MCAKFVFLLPEDVFEGHKSEFYNQINIKLGTQEICQALAF